MLDVESIFRHRVWNPKKCADFGFVPAGSAYSFSADILDGQFRMDVVVESGSLPKVRVLDTDSGEEYVLIHAPEASGSFVGEVVHACEAHLKRMAEVCCDHEIFRSAQAKELIAYAEEKYHSRPEFLWEKFSDSAVLRRTDTGKWFAVLLTVSGEKLGLAGRGRVEVLDLRESPEQVAGLAGDARFLPGYHMNKKTWYTVCLDGSVDTREIFRRMDVSYQLAK